MLKNIKEDSSNCCNTNNVHNNSYQDTSRLETIEMRSIKKILREDHLEYVTEYLKNLLDIKKANNPDAFRRRLYGTYKGERVILYIRLSVEDLERAEGDVSKSILNQLLMLLARCHENNYEVVGIFYEEDISGSDESRIEWNKSLTFCELGNADIYLCKTQARFARDVEMIEHYLHKRFVEWDIRFISIVDNIDTAIKGNKLQRQITAIVDENKLSEQSINTKATLRDKNKAGQWTGSFAPYGYIEDPEDMYHLVVEESAAKIVREIYKRFANGDGYSKICTYLNESKIPTPSKHKKLLGLKFKCKNAPNGAEYWNTDTIRKILMDETYDGKLIQHRTEKVAYNIKKFRKVPKEEQIIIENAHERIVDPDVSKIVREKFRDRREKKQLREAKKEADNLVLIAEEGLKKDKSINKESKKTIKLKIKELSNAILENEKEKIINCHNELKADILNLNSKIILCLMENVNGLSNDKTRCRTCKDGTVHLFSQKVYCKCCGKTFTRTKSKTGPRKSPVKQYKDYLMCRSKRMTAGMSCENRNTIRYEVLEEYVLNKINEKITEHYNKSKVEKTYYNKKLYSNYQNDIKALEKEKGELDNKIKSNNDRFALIYDDRANGILTPEEFVMLKNKYNSDNQKFSQRIKNIDEEIKEINEKKEQSKNVQDIFKKYKKIKKLDRMTLDTFVSKIIVGKLDIETKQRPIKIIWNTAV